MGNQRLTQYHRHYTTHRKDTLSSSSFVIDSTNSYIRQIIGLRLLDGSEEISNIFTNTGIQNSITIYIYDADGDSLTGIIIDSLTQPTLMPIQGFTTSVLRSAMVKTSRMEIP